MYACLVMLAAAYIGQELFSRKTPSFAFETKANEENKVFLKDYPMAFKFDDYYTNDLSLSPGFLDSIEIQVLLFHVIREKLEVMRFEVKPCDPSFVDPVFLEKTYEAYKHRFFCPDFSIGYTPDGQVSDLGLYITRGFRLNNSSFLSVFINDCDKANSECKDFKHINGVFFFSTITYDSFSEASDYKDPIKKKINKLIGQISNSFYTRQFINIDYNFLITDDGWFTAQEDTRLFYSIGNARTEIANYSQDLRHLYQFTFIAPPKEKITKRLYLKVPEIIAFVGGFSKAILLSLKLLLDVYTDYWLKIEVLNGLKTERQVKLRSNSRFIVNQPNQANRSGSVDAVVNSTAKAVVKQESHLKQFFKSLFCSSHPINKKYYMKIENLDIITIMHTVEDFNRLMNMPAQR